MRYTLKGVSLVAMTGLIFATGCEQPNQPKNSQPLKQQSTGQQNQSSQNLQPNQTRSMDQKKMGMMTSNQTSSNIVELAKGAGTFNTLVKALQSAGLVDTLSRGGPYTVFAPTDAAFAQLSPGELDDWMKPENKMKLQQILKYHVVEGKMSSSQLKGGKTFTTLEGDTLTVKDQNGKMMVNGAMIEGADIEASNGVIHSINKVLMPPSEE